MAIDDRAQLGSAESDPVVILDVDTGGAQGPRASARLRVSAAAARERSRQADRDRVTAVLIVRAITRSRLLSCVQAATRGESISPELLCEMLPENECTGGHPSHPELTKRDRDVLQLLADGESTRGIAERLSYSERTVKNIVRDVLLKLGCRTRAHAVALAARRGVI
jgi:DNA-binding NarL/FixJ family response regulator